MDLLELKINGCSIQVKRGTPLMKAATEAGIYIPCLCSHPDLLPPKSIEPSEYVYRGEEQIHNKAQLKNAYNCGLCLAEVEGFEGTVPLSMITIDKDMVIHTDTPLIKRLRTENLSQIFDHHPHVCLTCAQREGCSLTECSSNVPEDERCCPKFNRCELRKIVEYVGIREDIKRYQHEKLAVIKEPLIAVDYNLCIGCLRCVRICKDIRGVEALGFVLKNDKIIVGTKEPTLRESGCKFCGACIEVCPTGSLMDIDVKIPDEESLIPCLYSCPVQMNVPQYVRYIHDERYDDALKVVLEKVPFPLVLGYVCHHPC
ncbi:MAG: 4Fe-4S dicluster domain-containing protein, partial [Fidelibacterota bacterium]